MVQDSPCCKKVGQGLYEMAEVNEAVLSQTKSKVNDNSPTLYQ